ncbi:MAG TPA: nucleotide sugar dehydrogenase [Candidatus Limnocylindria bacterium]|nr:nucleotide sugar dehydrogenase [Candidatus Limnocylindria bacterium]
MHLFLLGAGHVGLVTAVGLARLGHQVTVADIDPARIEGLRAGRAPIYEPGLDDALVELRGRLGFATDLRPPDGVRHSFVAVGTPQGPDGPLSLDHVLNAVGGLLEVTGPGHTIVVRSTLRMAGPAALASLRGARPDAPAIVTNPEFMREGSALRDFANPGRVITGWIDERDRPAAEEVITLYAGIDAPTLVADATSVALIKLASNVFLAMKVAYANELARLSDAFGADAPLVADGLGMDVRIGRAFLDAGPGFGGSCLPEQAVALAGIAAAAGVPAPLIDSIAVANRTHQGAIAERLGRLIAEAEGSGPPRQGPEALRGAQIGVLGLAFKANTDDVRESPAIAIAAELRAAGANVTGTDPRASAAAQRADPELVVVATPAEAAAGADAIMIATEWPEYGSLDWAAIAAVMRGTVVYDTRGIADPAAVAAAGLTLERLGRR